MKKLYFLILVLSLFFAPTLQAQQTVALPDSVAAWYLERNQKLTVLEKVVSNLREEISNLEYQIKINLEIKGTFVEDTKQLNNKLQLAKDELKHAQGEANALKKQIRGYILKQWLAYGIALLVIIITLVTR